MGRGTGRREGKGGEEELFFIVKNKTQCFLTARILLLQASSGQRFYYASMEKRKKLFMKKISSL